MRTIHIYTKKFTPRQLYIFRILFDDHFSIHDNYNEYTQSYGYKIAYTDESFPDTHLHIVPDGLLHGTAILPGADHLPGAPWTGDRLPERTDIFSLAFFMLSRMEEYNSPHTDVHGRFQPQKSILAPHGIALPWVDVWRKLLWDEILYRVPDAIFNKPEFRILPTFDIDHAYAYRGKGWLQNTGGWLRDILTGRSRAAAERLRYFRTHEDPYDTYVYISQQLRSHNLKAVFFLLCGERNPPYDTPVPLQSEAYRNLLNELRAAGTVGLHPSYASHDDLRILQSEYKKLQDAVPSVISQTRQHFLRIAWPGTFRRMLQLGIKADFTMGYAHTTGFRAGTCRPFPWFDLESNRETGLMLYPFSCMDGTLNEHLGLSPAQAIEEVRRLRAVTRTYGGVFVPHWHNHSLSEKGHWQGWRAVFEETLRS